MSSEDSADYRYGYNVGSLQGMITAAQAHTDAMERLKGDLAWARFHLEKHDDTPAITEHIALLRSSWRLDLVSGDVRTSMPTRRPPNTTDNEPLAGTMIGVPILWWICPHDVGSSSLWMITAEKRACLFLLSAFQSQVQNRRHQT